jgi:hypothetical protein
VAQDAPEALISSVEGVRRVVATLRNPVQYGPVARVEGVVRVVPEGRNLVVHCDERPGIVADVVAGLVTPLSPYRIVFEVLAVNAVLDFLQLLPALLVVFLLHPISLAWVLAVCVALFATLVAANCIGIFIANFTSSPADVLLYATAILFPLIYISGFFRNQNPEGVMLALRHLVPFAYANDALKTVFGLSTGTAPVEAIVYPTLICAVMALGVCLTAPRLLRTRL